MTNISRLLASVCFSVASLSPALAQAQPAQPQSVSFASLDSTQLSALMFQPSGKPRGTVVALHGCGGMFANTGARKGELNARHQAMAQMLLAQGFAVVYPDSLTPRGETELCTQKIGSRKIDQKERRADALGALAWVAAQPWGDAQKLALVGWSHGGSAVLAATDGSRPEVQAASAKAALAIAFYPGCSAGLKAGYQMTAPLTLMIGEKDDWTPPGPCIELGKSVGAEVNVYAGSYHGFDAPSGGVQLRKDVPNGINPGQGVHVGANPVARQSANARVVELLESRFPKP
jgi:dienelactone hydrolase